MKKNLLILLISFTAIGYSQFWTEKASTFTTQSRGVNQFYIVDSNVVWATAYDGSSAGANVQEFAKSIDGGDTWTANTFNLGASNAGLSLSNICAISEDIAWVATFGNTIFNRGGIFKTIDGGISWTEQTTAAFTNLNSFPNVVYFWDANNGFCQGDPIDGYFELYTTTSGGTNWTRVPSASIPAPLSGEYGYVRQIEVINNRLWWTTNKGRIFRSDDLGLTFDVFQSPINDFGGSATNGSISFWDENNGLLVANTGSWKTNDGGANWSPLSYTGTIFNGDISCVPGNTGNAISVSGASGSSGSSYSTDYGLTWTLIDVDQHIGVEFKHGIGLTGGFTTSATTGGLSKYTGTELPLSTKDQNITTFKAYPNPVKDIFTIEGIGHISNVSLFNALGQNIMKFTPNTNTTTLDLSTISSGTYFVKVTINDATETMKIVK